MTYTEALLKDRCALDDHSTAYIGSITLTVMTYMEALLKDGSAIDDTLKPIVSPHSDG